MPALKVLVFGMAFLIVVMLTILGWGIYKKSSNPDFKFFDLSGTTSSEPVDGPQVPTGPVTTTQNPTATPFPDLHLRLSDDCSVAKMVAAGELLYLHIGPAFSACEQILVIDSKKGRKLGTIDVRP